VDSCKHCQTKNRPHLHSNRNLRTRTVTNPIHYTGVWYVSCPQPIPDCPCRTRSAWDSDGMTNGWKRYPNAT